jgi:hypothetical protein
MRRVIIDIPQKPRCGKPYEYTARKLGWDPSLTCKEAFVLTETICTLPMKHPGPCRGSERGK